MKRYFQGHALHNVFMGEGGQLSFIGTALDHGNARAFIDGLNKLQAALTKAEDDLVGEQGKNILLSGQMKDQAKEIENLRAIKTKPWTDWVTQSQNQERMIQELGEKLQQEERNHAICYKRQDEEIEKLDKDKKMWQEFAGNTANMRDSLSSQLSELKSQHDALGKLYKEQHYENLRLKGRIEDLKNPGYTHFFGAGPKVHVKKKEVENPIDIEDLRRRNLELDHKFHGMIYGLGPVDLPI